MAAKSVTLKKAGRSWPTQANARKHFSQMLTKYTLGQRVTEEADHNDLLALLEIYDTSGSKRGAGVEYFFLDRDRENRGPTNCFYVKRSDGTEMDFSVHKAIVYASKIQAAT